MLEVCTTLDSMESKSGAETDVDVVREISLMLLSELTSSKKF
jgi:hypothetical protein